MKVYGAAQGGSLLVLVDPQAKKQIAEACQSQGIQVLPANVSTQGVQIEF